MSTDIETQAPEIPEVRSRKGTPTWEIAFLFPDQGTWSEQEYLALDTNHLIEYCDGHLEFLPMTDMFHQDLVAFVYKLLTLFVEGQNLGRVYFAPLRIRTIPRKIREPDVVFVRPERIKDRRTPPNGADLVVEIVSPGEDARKRDLETKRDEYARAGISEYWIVDPEKETVKVLTLEGESYREHGQFQQGQTADSVLLEGFQLDVSALFAAGQAGEKKS